MKRARKSLCQIGSAWCNNATTMHGPGGDVALIVEELCIRPDSAVFISTSAGDTVVEQASDYGVRFEGVLHDDEPETLDGLWVAFVQSTFERDSLFSLWRRRNEKRKVDRPGWTRPKGRDPWHT